MQGIEVLHAQELGMQHPTTYWINENWQIQNTW